jgi:hypothetical protein
MAKRESDPGLPGLRNATRVGGINGGRVFGEGDGGAVHQRTTLTDDRENGLPGVQSFPEPYCISDVMAQGSPRPGYTSGGREPLRVFPGPGRYAQNRDGTDAEIGAGPEADRPEPAGPFDVDEDSWRPGLGPSRPEKTESRSATKPPV